ncbi:MAG: twin-arginine translocase subunit TatC [Gemmatales bacterium]|nr:twin-arginine translocase subunit TatC [Gemmatales bacterium]MDW8222159.1 twin-arginine translocase subunit TatC [Gemmatales bacterium]
MPTPRPPLPDPEDMFADTRMTFGEHLEDLRQHLWRAIWSFVIAVLVSFLFANYVLRIIQDPVERALIEYHYRYFQNNPGRELPMLDKVMQELQKPHQQNDPLLKEFTKPIQLEGKLQREDLDQALRQMYPQWFPQNSSSEANAAAGHQPSRTEVASAQASENATGGAPESNKSEKAAQASIPVQVSVRPIDLFGNLRAPFGLLTRRATLIAMNPMETFMVWFKVAILSGLVLGSPWIFYHIWSFIAAGLYPHEKRLVYNSLFPSVGLFLIGVIVCQLVVIPAALRALLEFNLWLNIEPDFRLSEWLGFAILMPVITGLCFQLPLVMYVLGRIGIVTPEQMASKRRLAWFVMLIVVAIITPSIDPASLLIIWLPMLMLYELGLWMVRVAVRRLPEEEEQVPYEPRETWWDWEDVAQSDGRR